MPSIAEIRGALGDITGALRDEPLAEDVRDGTDRATPIWLPDGGDAAEATTLPMTGSPDDGDGFSDEPGLIFEVPPDLTDADIQNILGERETGALKRLEQVRGIDALGWYVTFHQRRYQHGIYIPATGVLLLAIGALAGLPVTVERKIELAFHAIYRHELFHFAADCMAANWELATGRDVYWKAKTALRNAAGYIDLEEALANAYMLRGFKWPTRTLKSAGAYAALGRYCHRQPDGYNLGPDYARDHRRYVTACQSLSTKFQHASAVGPKWPDWKVPPELDAARMYPDITRIAWQRCPIFFLDDDDLLGLLGITLDLFPSIHNLTETDHFKAELEGLERPVRNKWNKCRRMLEQSTGLKGLDFKRWKPGGPDCYSVRVDLKYRAHLEYLRSEHSWLAVEIGDHKSMGHG